MNRRRYLVLCIGIPALLAGCANRPLDPSESRSPTTDPRATSRTRSDATTSPTGPPPTDPSTAEPAPHLGQFVLWNDDDDPHRVSLTVGREGRVLVDETRELSPGAAADVENPIETQGTYRVTASLADGTRVEREWDVSRCIDIEYLQVYVGDTAAVEIRTKRRTIDPPPTPC